MVEKFSFIAESQLRVDKLINIENITRSGLMTLFENGYVMSSGKPIAKNYKPKIGEIIEVFVPEAKEVDIVPQDIPLVIAYEDDDLLVVNKPKGMVVHPAPGNPDKTLVNALLFHCGSSLSGINGEIRPGIVHRIDKDTSGLLVVAKNDFAHHGLAEQIKLHSFEREYRAIVYGKPKDEIGTISAPIGRNPNDRKKMAVLWNSNSAREATTHYELIENFKSFSYLKFNLETGRTHQIRVHSSYMKFPIAGDPLYGPSKVITELDGQCLHAGVLGFIHPRTGEHIRIESELPEYFTRFLNKLRNIG